MHKGEKPHHPPPASAEEAKDSGAKLHSEAGDCPPSPTPGETAPWGILQEEEGIVAELRDGVPALVVTLSGWVEQR